MGFFGRESGGKPPESKITLDAARIRNFETGILGKLKKKEPLNSEESNELDSLITYLRDVVKQNQTATYPDYFDEDRPTPVTDLLKDIDRLRNDITVVI